MGRHRHDGAGAVSSQNVVGNENGDLLAVDGVDAHNAVQLHAGLVLVQLGTLQVRLGGGGGLVGLDRIGVIQPVHPLGDQGVLGGQDHIGGAEQGVGPGGVHQDLVAQGGLEFHLRAMAAADPVGLLGLDPVDEVHILQIINEPVSVLGDTQHPLALFLADNRRTAALADALDHFLIGQNALAACTPVHGHLGLVGQTVFVKLQENPLGPLKITGVRSIDFPVPVKAVAQSLQLAAEILDVVLGDDTGMDMILNGKVLRRQAEGIIAHGEQHVHASHPLFPGDDIHGRIGPGVAHMQSCGAGIREFHQGEELFLLAAVLSGVEFFLLPDLLPLFFNVCKFVIHNEYTFLKSSHSSIMISFRSTVSASAHSRSRS